MRRPPPTLVRRQAAIRIDLALEARHERSASLLGQAPGVVGGVQQMGTDAAPQCTLGWAGATPAPSHQRLRRTSPTWDADPRPVGNPVIGPSHSTGSPPTVTMIRSCAAWRRIRCSCRRKTVRLVRAPWSRRRTGRMRTGAWWTPAATSCSPADARTQSSVSSSRRRAGVTRIAMLTTVRGLARRNKGMCVRFGVRLKPHREQTYRPDVWKFVRRPRTDVKGQLKLPTPGQ